MTHNLGLTLALLAWFGLPFRTSGAEPPQRWALPDERLAAYFENETERIADACLEEIVDADDWARQKEKYRRQLREMLGLKPWPERTDLQARITGRVEQPGFTVENLHFQSLPGLYVTGNLYLPKNIEQPAPAILYVCGHARVVKDGISYGNKTAYHHHGVWFAKHGYVCLTIDTIQLGEIEGLHHGTYREGMWWWNARGYTPAGVEAWNGIRALDYLSTRPEVDPDRFGITGRSGGGVYSWWVAALDERIKAAAPVAGITDLRNHVVDGAVEGHCDCMFMVNTYRWDYPQVAALLAPRPLLIANSDRDTIFPLDGVVRLHAKVRRIYELHDAAENLGLVITPGPHRDTQELRVPVFHWFNRFLKNEDPLLAEAADKPLAPEQLRVFEQLPADERTSVIHESFVNKAEPELPKDRGEWNDLKNEWLARLEDLSFRGWPSERGTLTKQDQFVSGEWLAEKLEMTSQPAVPLHLYTLRRAANHDTTRHLLVHILDEQTWDLFAAHLRPIFERQHKTIDAALLSRFFEGASGPTGPHPEERTGHVYAWVAPRGVGPSGWNAAPRKQTQIRRRYMLLGQTLDGMRTWDIRGALVLLNNRYKPENRTVTAHGAMSVNTIYANLFNASPSTVHLREPPSTHRQGPIYLNVLRFMDIPQAVALAAERFPVHLHVGDRAPWRYPARANAQFEWDRLTFEKP